LDDFVEQCQPYYAVALGEATEGRSWDWTLEGFKDGSGADVDFSGCAITCKVLDDIDGATKVTLTTVGGADGTLRFHATPTDTAGTAGTGSSAAQFPWHLTVTTPTGRKADVFGVEQSRLVIRQGAAV